VRFRQNRRKLSAKAGQGIKAVARARFPKLPGSLSERMGAIGEPVLRLGGGLGLSLIGLCLLTALLSYDPADPSNFEPVTTAPGTPR